MTLPGCNLESLRQALWDAKAQTGGEVNCGRLHGRSNSEVDRWDYLRPALTAAKSAEAAVSTDGIEAALGGMAGTGIDRRE